MTSPGRRRRYPHLGSKLPGAIVSEPLPRAELATIIAGVPKRAARCAVAKWRGCKLQNGGGVHDGPLRASSGFHPDTLGRTQMIGLSAHLA